MAGLGEVEWEGARVVSVTIAEPPAFLLFDARRARDALGLPVPAAIWAFYAGEPPQLCRIDPATGREEAVAEVPPDVFQAALNREGTALLTLSYKLRTKTVEGRVIDLSSGEASQLEGDFAPQWVDYGEYLLRWIGAQTYLQAAPARTKTGLRIVTADGEVVTSLKDPVGSRRSVSPDGRWVAGYADFAYLGNNRASFDLVVLELATGKTTRYKDIIINEIPAGEASGPNPVASPAWSRRTGN